MTSSEKKIKSDRKRLRVIDHNLSKYTLMMTFAQLAMCVLFVILGGMTQGLVAIMAVSSIIMLFFTALHVILHLQFDYFYGRGPLRYQRVGVIVYGSYLVIWNSLVVFLISYYQSVSLIYLLVIFSFGCAVLSVICWAPYLRMNRFCLTVSLLPIALSLVVIGSSANVVMSSLLVIFYAGLLKLAERAYVIYWDWIQKDDQLDRAMRDLEHALVEAQSANSVKIDFLGNLTHEIRTPMNSVLGMISLLSDTRLDKNQLEMLSVANHSCESLLNLIGDILDFSKIATGKISIDSTVFNLRQCIEEIIEPLGPLAHEKNIEINMVFDQNMPLRIRTDPLRIGQITQNFVMNAVKFSDDGEILVEVHLTRLSNMQGLLRVHVTDEGVGISQDQQAKLFEAFYRTEKIDSKSSGGTGLGLAICKGLVERMEGQIGLISELGKGSTFWFTVPVRLSTQQKQITFSQQKFVGCRVLLVNAPKGMRQALVNDLSIWEIEVESITGTDKALQVLRSSIREGCGFQIVILNITLHYSGTFSFSRKVAEDPLLKDIKQILVTTLQQGSSEKAVNHKRQIESLSYVTKPITHKALEEAFKELFDENPRIKMDSVQPVDLEFNASSKGNLLLVEDNNVNQMVAKGILAKLGYAVKVVENGAIAVDLVKDNKFDLILMDCQMPVLDGYEATERIRELEQENQLPRTPIIAMTAYAMDSDTTKCLACGMDDFLAKPVKKEELDSKISMWLEKYRAVESEGVLRFPADEAEEGTVKGESGPLDEESNGSRDQFEEPGTPKIE